MVKPNWDRIPSSNLCSPFALNAHCMFFSFSEHLSIQLASFLNIWPMNPLAQNVWPFWYSVSSSSKSPWGRHQDHTHTALTTSYVVCRRDDVFNKLHRPDCMFITNNINVTNSVEKNWNDKEERNGDKKHMVLSELKCYVLSVYFRQTSVKNVLENTKKHHTNQCETE